MNSAAQSGMEAALLSEPDLYLLATSHLRLRYPENLAAKVLRDNALVVLKTCDGYDAARLLLVPLQLESGQAIAATIPDRDTLSLSPPPRDDGWDGLREAAKASVGSALCSSPPLVTRESIQIRV